jgi:hypothetical protein
MHGDGDGWRQQVEVAVSHGIPDQAKKGRGEVN